MNKIAIIRKLPNGKYELVSKKKDNHGKRKNLGVYDTLSGAKERERQVQYFKHQHAEDGQVEQEEDVLAGLSDLAIQLEEAGKQKEADVVYKCMIELEKETQNIVDQQLAPDRQMNTDNSGYIGGDGIAGGYSLGVDEGKIASVIKKDTFNKFIAVYVNNGNKEIVVGINRGGENKSRTFADEHEAMLFFNQLGANAQYSLDSVVNLNGIENSSYLDGAAGFNGLSDAYFYRNIGNNDTIYDAKNK